MLYLSVVHWATAWSRNDFYFANTSHLEESPHTQHCKAGGGGASFLSSFFFVPHSLFLSVLHLGSHLCDPLLISTPGGTTFPYPLCLTFSLWLSELAPCSSGRGCAWISPAWSLGRICLHLLFFPSWFLLLWWEGRLQLTVFTVEFFKLHYLLELFNVKSS